VAVDIADDFSITQYAPIAWCKSHITPDLHPGRNPLRAPMAQYWGDLLMDFKGDGVAVGLVRRLCGMADSRYSSANSSKCREYRASLRIDWVGSLHFPYHNLIKVN